MQTLDAHGAATQLTSNADTSTAPTAAAPNSNFWRHCSWSPDGTCVLAAQDDNVVQIFAAPHARRDASTEAALDANADKLSRSNKASASKVPQLELAVAVPQSESLYACDWYPGFRADDAQTACFAVSCRGQPVHLWDAFLGTQRSTYRTYDQVDEVATAHALRFHPDGERLVAGLKESIVCWHVARPGRDHTTIRTKASAGPQTGILSCVAMPVMGDILAAGSFNRTVGVYDLRDASMQMLLSGHSGGVTHVQFSRCGNFVYSGARRDGALLCWDVRHTGECLYRLPGHVSNSPQRLAFDIEPSGRLLFAGGTDGRVRVYDLAQGSLERELEIAGDTVGAVGLHPTLPMLLTASGHRRFADISSDESSDDDGVHAAGASRAKRQRTAASWQLGPHCNELAVWRLESAPMVEPEGEVAQHHGADASESVAACDPIVDAAPAPVDPVGAPTGTA